MVCKAVKRYAGDWVGSGRSWSFLADLQTSVFSNACQVPKIRDCFCCHCPCLERDVTVEESESRIPSLLGASLPKIPLVLCPGVQVRVLVPRILLAKHLPWRLHRRVGTNTPTQT